ncbi:MAG TPA: serine acetyltransferase [Nitrospira sp.]|nr:serine acetyltransferase [Nitrospira sp.]
MHIPKRKRNKLVSKHGVLFLLREDYERHRQDSTRAGFRAIASYRFAVWARGLHNSGLRLVFSSISQMVLRFVRNQYGIELYATSTIGRRFQIGHQNGIVIHKFATIGDDCRVRHGVTLGVGGIRRAKSPESFRDNAPVLGNGVDVGAGAVIVGKIRIGDGVKIGPNAVVLTDVPAGATVMAPMPKIIRVEPETGAVSSPTGHDIT